MRKLVWTDLFSDEVRFLCVNIPVIKQVLQLSTTKVNYIVNMPTDLFSEEGK